MTLKLRKLKNCPVGSLIQRPNQKDAGFYQVVKHFDPKPLSLDVSKIVPLDRDKGQTMVLCSHEMVYLDLHSLPNNGAPANEPAL